MKYNYPWNFLGGLIRRPLILGLLTTSVLLAADYTKEIDKIAAELLKSVPKGKTIVVFNFTRAGRVETQNCIDLATTLTGSLVRAGGRNWSIINRKTGEQLWYAEELYTVKPGEPAALESLLAQFKADVGIVGAYQLFDRSLVLENITAQYVPGPNQKPQVIAAPARRTIKLTPEDSNCLWAMEKTLPQPPDSITTAFLEHHTEQLLATAEIQDAEGRRLKDNCVRIGNTYRLSIAVKEDAYLYVFSYDEDHNRTYLLYPLEGNAPPVPKGKFLLPDKDHQFEAIPPAGRNSILVFATRKPVRLTVPSTENWEMENKALASFLNQLRAFDPGDWSRYMIFVHIRE